MRPSQVRAERAASLRPRLDRLDGLPLRPATARLAVAAWDSTYPGPDGGSGRSAALDPGWVLAAGPEGTPRDPLSIIEARPWWPEPTPDAVQAVGRLWRHAVAVACAARRLAAEAGDPDPDRLFRVGLLHSLALWAVAAVEPAALPRLLAEPDPARRRVLERDLLGKTAGELGRDLARRWSPDPLLADAAWLSAEADRGLSACSTDPERLSLIRRAVSWAERTPWALHAGGDLPRDPATTDPRVLWLTAEVQSRCGSSTPFVEPGFPGEEALIRSHARLSREVQTLRAGVEARDRFLNAFAQADPLDSAETWAAAVESAWSSEPGVESAQLVWAGSEPEEPDRPDPAERTIPLEDRGRPLAEIRLRGSQQDGDLARNPYPALAAWSAWTRIVADRNEQADHFSHALEAYRGLGERTDAERLAERLEAMAEFAAGAGHELNNPLAVIVGRAQLLLARWRDDDPDAARSLRAIITQAQRAHRILRDLMYVARPAPARPRPCQTDEVVRACLRDLRDEAEGRSVRLELEERGGRPTAPSWADPEPLRHLADTLVRNAIEATPPGGVVRFVLDGDDRQVAWTVHDSGRGLDAGDADHLLDPFYCGRQAGRGLGLGLPRAARFVSQAGGNLRWRSTPGRGATFHVSLPRLAPPAPGA